MNKPAALVVGSVLLALPSLAHAQDAQKGPPNPNTGWTAPVALEPPPSPKPVVQSGAVNVNVQAPPPIVPADPTAAAPEAAPARYMERDRAADGPPKTGDPLVDARVLHGFRLGYSYVFNYDKPLDSLDGATFKDKTKIKSPNNLLIGYEVMGRLVGHSWLNVIMVGNVIIAGIEQSKVLPSGNAIIGFELNNSFQVGLGAHLTPLKGQEAHAVFAAGWTPRVGSFYVPLHGFFIPDVDGNHRTGVTTGVTW
jgi:hypothetical protein